MSDLAAPDWRDDWRDAPRRRETEARAPALLAALALHLGLFALLMWARPASVLPLGSAVPITLVSRDPTTDSRAAEAAPQVQSARTETPVPAARPPAPAAAPPPAPAQPARPTPMRATPAPSPSPTPHPSRAAPTPAPAARPPSPSRTRPSPAFSLDALQADIAKAARTAPARPAFAARGPARAETALRARPDAGEGVSMSDLQGLQQLLERLWNPNCEAPGGDTVLVPVRFSVGDDGRLIGRVSELAPAGGAVAGAAARRAIDAVHEAEPYAQAYRGKSFTVNFDARKACAAR